MEWQERVRAAVEAWQQALGHDAVVLDAAAIKAAQTATFATAHRLLAIVVPESVEALQAAMRIATKHEVAVYPTSRGRNWGMGSRAPTADRCVLVDLSRLDRIRHLDDDLGVVRLETGVSFRQLHEALVEKGATHHIPVIGGPADASVLANLLMRGDRIGPWVGHLDELCDLEVVLPTGELLRTGFGRFGDHESNALEPWGLGPALSGLFSQSNLGIVTAATLPLRRRAPAIRSFGFELTQPELPRVIDGLRELVRDQAIAPRCVALWNTYKALAVQGRFPWGRTEGRTPLNLGELDGVERWTVTGSVHAPSDAVAEALQAHITGVVEPLGTAHWWMETPGDPTLVGTPTDANLGSVYWRSRTVVKDALDPNRDGCGLLWLCHLLPFDGDAIHQAVEVVHRRVLEDGFEPNLGFQVVSARAVRFFTAIAYDRRLDGDDARALACHDRVMSELAALGHLPFRLGVQSMNSMPAGDATHARLVKAVKDATDPAAVLAPGLYDRD